MPLGTRRAIVWILSVVLGVASAIGTVLAFGTTFERYGFANIAVLAVGYFGVLWIWLDFFLKSDMLPK